MISTRDDFGPSRSDGKPLPAHLKRVRGTSTALLLLLGAAAATSGNCNGGQAGLRGSGGERGDTSDSAHAGAGGQRASAGAAGSSSGGSGGAGGDASGSDRGGSSWASLGGTAGGGTTDGGSWASLGGTAGGGTTGGRSSASLGGTAGTSAVVEDVAAGNVCARLSELQCEAEGACCESPGRSVEECKKAMAQKCAGLYLDQISQSSVSGYSPSTAGLVLAEFQRRSATCDPAVVEWGASASGLRSFFTGTEGPSADCTPKSLLDPADAAAHLMACRNPADTACLPGLLAWKCTPLASTGGACFSDMNCQDGLYCDNPQTALVGATCKARKTAGAACTAGSQCASLVCKRAVCVAADVQAVYCLNDG